MNKNSCCKDCECGNLSKELLEKEEEIKKLKRNKQTREIDHYEASKLIIALQEIIEMDTIYSNATVKRIIIRARRARNHWVGLS